MHYNSKEIKKCCSTIYQPWTLLGFWLQFDIPSLELHNILVMTYWKYLVAPLIGQELKRKPLGGTKILLTTKDPSHLHDPWARNQL